MEWTREKLLPALPDRAVITIDNASYHSTITGRHLAMINCASSISYSAHYYSKSHLYIYTFLDESRNPTTSWKRQAIADWLTAEGIAYETGLRKAELLAISKR